MNKIENEAPCSATLLNAKKRRLDSGLQTKRHSFWLSIGSHQMSIRFVSVLSALFLSIETRSILAKWICHINPSSLLLRMLLCRTQWKQWRKTALNKDFFLHQLKNYKSMQISRPTLKIQNVSIERKKVVANSFFLSRCLCAAKIKFIGLQHPVRRRWCAGLAYCVYATDNNNKRKSMLINFIGIRRTGIDEYAGKLHASACFSTCIGTRATVIWSRFHCSALRKYSVRTKGIWFHVNRNDTLQLT